ISSQRLDRGILYASGLIAGESLGGIALAFLASRGIGPFGTNISGSLTTALTIVGAVGLMISFYLFSRPRNN
ncbi:MAG: hypothetical protein VYA53_01550, partial [Acidobacteriota bacterium]|nr:hypothetical protein [Acidobacteriota bacterium]